MKIDIAAPHFPLTDGLRDYVERRFSPLERFHGRVTSTAVVLDRATAHRERPYVVKARSTLPRGEAHVIAREDELYAAIDAAAEKLGAKLRKAHERQGQRRSSHDAALSAR
jgi:putative sigma-54 modulation protein